MLVSIDDSPLAKKALAWALRNCMVHPQVGQAGGISGS